MKMRTILLALVPFIFLLSCEDIFAPDDAGNGDSEPETEAGPLDELEFRGFVDVPGGTYIQQDTHDNEFEHIISSFSVAQYPVTYELWYEVRQWALDNGYSIENLGQEGSEGTEGQEPTEDAKHEPVTRVNWRNSVVWMNAYSEITGRTPVYYVDSDFTNPVRDAASPEDTSDPPPGSADNPFVRWEADGYRLPTEGEWQYAASWRGEDNQDGDGNVLENLDEFDQNGTTWYWTPPGWASGATGSTNDVDTTTSVAWYDQNADKSQQVGQKNPNHLQLYDMSGNVEEWTWDAGSDSTNFPPQSPQTDYRGPGPTAETADGRRIYRGGNYSFGASRTAVGSRPNTFAGAQSSARGIRTVRSSP